MFTDFIGFLAATGTTISFLPQALKVIKEKNVDGLSLGMYSIFTSGVFLWLVYGIMITDFAIIAANGVTLIFASIILFMIIKLKDSK